MSQPSLPSPEQPRTKPTIVYTLVELIFKPNDGSSYLEAIGS